ncbi:phosphotransferase [Arthrobacter sp. SLBN-122]|uniref:phosphotransferase n=1 Tax=Arthrobacter sp. SLBN-122 TaxID=2768455 RepID=UPI00114EEEEB|nr:phosphotransferase [Arthrobacter sp. SLBN-122]TQJ34314.1 CheY-like chemotaxis protein [Arthrobacter sp. SLBN-122]
MKVLLIEDEDRSIRLTSDALARVTTVTPTIARYRDAALSAIRFDEFDLILCDLRIPPTANSLDISEEHGLAVHSEARTVCPGTPIIFLTGFATPSNITDQLSSGGVADIYGLNSVPMVQLCLKSDLARLDTLLRGFAKALSDLDDWCKVESTLTISPMMARAVRCYAKSIGSRSAAVTPLQGLSGAEVATARFTDTHGGIASVFVKVLDFESARDELNRYHQFAGNRLEPGFFAPALTATFSGLRKEAALFSTLAGNSYRSIFQVLRESPEAGAEIVRRLQVGMEAWHSPTVPHSFSLADLRRARIPDEKLPDGIAALPELLALEEISVEVRTGVIHGDLHGENVLVNANGGPMLIDFGDLGVGTSASDPITLELSVLFHLQGPARGSGWPQPRNLESWWDIDRFAEGAPHEEFLRACRSWASSIDTEAAICAIAYSHALRQLKYDDVDPDIAVAIAASAASFLTR